MANAFPTPSQHVEQVIHHVQTSEKPMNLRQALTEAGINEFGKKRWNEVMDRIRSELFVGRKYADLAGVKILPVSRGKNATEAWAKGRGFKAVKNSPLPSFEVAFDISIYNLINESDQLPETSHRRLAPRVRSALVGIARTPFSKAQIVPLKIFVDAMTSELEQAVVTANGHREAAILAKENAALTQKLLSFSDSISPSPVYEKAAS